MKIGEVAKKAGVGIDTIRYYERRGLVTARRQPSGYRHFSPTAVERIVFARELQTLGFSLDEIVTVLRQMDRGTRVCAEPSAFDAALARIDEKIAELRAVRRRLTQTIRDCRDGRCLLVERSPRLKSS